MIGQRSFKLRAIVGVGQELAQRLGTLLPQALKNEDTSLPHAAWKQRDGGVVLATGASLSQTLIDVQFTGQRLLVEEIHLAAYTVFYLLEIELVCEQRYPGIGSWAAHKHIVSPFQIAPVKITRRCDDKL